MKTTFGQNQLTEQIARAKRGEINLIHMNTEMSIHDGIRTGAIVIPNSAEKEKERQKKFNCSIVD